jgi:hypothetical protein
MSNLLTNALLDVAVELIEKRAELAECERAFPYLSGGYYYDRKDQLEQRIEELESILSRAGLKEVKKTPVKQFLVTVTI